MVFFSSSSRSMRSMMALSWSLANRVAGASSWTAADVAIVYSSGVTDGEVCACLSCTALSSGDPRFCGASRQESITSSTAQPTGSWRARKEPWISPSMIMRMRLLHRLELSRSGRTLIFRLPLLVGHAVDRLAALVLRQSDALGVGSILHPVRQAVAAEAGKI